MNPIRLSVTMLDTYVSGIQNDEMTSEELAQQLFGKFEPSPAMAAGTAFHQFLEFYRPDTNPLEQALGSIRVGNYCFVLPDTLNGTLELGNRRERKYQWEILPNVVLVGKIDAETAFTVIDHKLTARFDHDRYMDSFQWRAYLAMRNKPTFAYQVFEHKHGKDLPEPDRNGLIHIEIKDYHRLEQAAYKSMVHDVKEVASDLAKFARQWQHLVRPQQPANDGFKAKV